MLQGSQHNEKQFQSTKKVLLPILCIFLVEIKKKTIKAEAHEMNFDDKFVSYENDILSDGMSSYRDEMTNMTVYREQIEEEFFSFSTSTTYQTVTNEFMTLLQKHSELHIIRGRRTLKQI